MVLKENERRVAKVTLKILVTSNGKRLTSDCGLQFAVSYAKLDAKGLYYYSHSLLEKTVKVVLVSLSATIPHTEAVIEKW